MVAVRLIDVVLPGAVVRCGGRADSFYTRRNCGGVLSVDLSLSNLDVGFHIFLPLIITVYSCLVDSWSKILRISPLSELDRW